MTNQFDPTAYSILVRRQELDGELLFVATVAELPDVAGIADTSAEAYEIALDAIAELKKASDEEGKQFPAPAPADTKFGGRVTLRMEKSLHRAATLLASTEGVSLNSLIVSALVARVAGATTATAGVADRHATRFFVFPDMRKTMQAYAVDVFGSEPRARGSLNAVLSKGIETVSDFVRLRTSALTLLTDDRAETFQSRSH